MRRFLMAVTCVMLALLLVVPALAASQLQFKVIPSVTQAAPGETVTFEVVVKGEAYSSLGYIPEYDNNVWDYVKGEYLPEDCVLGGFSKGQGGVMAFSDAEVRDEAVFRYTLKVKSNAPAGQTTLAGEVAARNGGTKLSAGMEELQITILAKEGVTVNQSGSAEATESEQSSQSASSEATEPEQSASSESKPDQEVSATGAADQNSDKDTTQKDTASQTIPNGGSVLTTGQETLADLGGDDSCVGDDVVFYQDAGVVSEDDNLVLVLWIAAGIVVVLCGAATWFFLRKKKKE